MVSDDPNSANFRIRDVALPNGLTTDHFLGRKDLRKHVDRLTRLNEPSAADPVRAADQFYEQSYSLITSKEAQQAFDIHQEPASIRDRYGRNGLGQRALLARRLVEAGVPFITLDDGGWGQP